MDGMGQVGRQATSRLTQKPIRGQIRVLYPREAKMWESRVRDVNLLHQYPIYKTTWYGIDSPITFLMEK